MTPRLSLQRQMMPGTLSIAFVYIVAIAIALGVGYLLMIRAGHDALSIYITTFSRVFMTWRGISETIVLAIPLYMGALGVAVAARLNLWNIGVEGQFMLGAFCATGLALYLEALPSPVLIFLMILAGFAAGGALALFSGVLRAWFGISEIVTTLLMNYVVGLWVGYFVHGPWKAPGSNVPETAEFAKAAQLPVILPDSRVHLGLLAALVCAAICHIFLNRSVWGYRIRVCGDNTRSAITAGIDFRRCMFLVMFLSGGLAGMAGMLEVSGAVHRLQDGMMPFYTMTAFMIAWIARLNVAGILLAGFLISGLGVAGYYMQFMGLPSAMVNLIEGVILLSVIAFEPLRRYSLRRVRGR